MITAPKLEELKTRDCSKEELQAALVHVIELHNALLKDLNAMVNNGRIRSSSEALMNTPYTL